MDNFVVVNVYANEKTKRQKVIESQESLSDSCSSCGQEENQQEKNQQEEKQQEEKIDTGSECNSDCGCEEDCECDNKKNCPKMFKRRPHKDTICKCEKCVYWDYFGVPLKPHHGWSCECDFCDEWVMAYFTRLHPGECECKYCLFTEVKTRFFYY